MLGISGLACCTLPISDLNMSRLGELTADSKRTLPMERKTSEFEAVKRPLNGRTGMSSGWV